MHEVPEGTDIADLIFDFVGIPSNPPLRHPSGDRHAAIACAAAIEHALKKAITLHLAPDADLRGLFEEYPSGPLTSFADRLTMARALGIVDAQVAHDLDQVRRLRNTFAHSVLPISFAQDDVAGLVSDLRILHNPTWRLFDTHHKQPRDRYVLTCAIHYTAINDYVLPPTPRERAAMLADSLLALPSRPQPQSPPASKPEDRNP